MHPFQPCCGICEFMARSLARGLYSIKNWLPPPDFCVIGSRQSRQVSTEELRVSTGPQNVCARGSNFLGLLGATERGERWEGRDFAPSTKVGVQGKDRSIG